jgi:hypothetical protein
MAGLRVPARFWMITILCLGVVAGLVVAAVLDHRSRISRALLTAALAAFVARRTGG